MTQKEEAKSLFSKLLVSLHKWACWYHWRYNSDDETLSLLLTISREEYWCVMEGCGFYSAGNKRQKWHSGTDGIEYFLSRSGFEVKEHRPKGSPATNKYIDIGNGLFPLKPEDQITENLIAMADNGHHPKLLREDRKMLDHLLAVCHPSEPNNENNGNISEENDDEDDDNDDEKEQSENSDDKSDDESDEQVHAGDARTPLLESIGINTSDPMTLKNALHEILSILIDNEVGLTEITHWNGRGKRSFVCQQPCHSSHSSNAVDGLKSYFQVMKILSGS